MDGAKPPQELDSEPAQEDYLRYHMIPISWDKNSIRTKPRHNLPAWISLNKLTIYCHIMNYIEIFIVHLNAILNSSE